MTVRHIGPDDWAQWRQARIRALTEDSAAFASSVTLWSGSRDVESAWRSRLAQPGARFLAYAGDAPVGMVGAYMAADGIELVSMWVASEARRQGIGSRLIDAVIDWAGGQALHLRVIAGNAAAISAYESRGFQLVADRPDAEGCCRMTRP